MSAAAPEPEEQRPTDETLLRQEEEAAAEEAGEIGGEVPRDSDDPAQQPLVESGQGESEGFELAEKDLEENATHGDEAGFPQSDVGAPEEASDAEYGEADQAIPEDGPDE
jgi:hypothetical protein